MTDTEDLMSLVDAAHELSISVNTLNKWWEIKGLKKGRQFFNGRYRAVVSAADVRRVKQERETVQWSDGQHGEE